MNIVIVGGGKVGYYLAKTLAAEHHNLSIVEQNREQCEKIVQEMGALGVDVINGDGTRTEVLRAAGAQKADTLVAVTGQDENNFVACKLASEFFNIQRTLARVNNPKNIEPFQQMGVGIVVSSTERIASLIEQTLDWNQVNDLLQQRIGDVQIKQLQIEPDFSSVGKTLADLRLPQGIVVISVVKAESVVIPDGKTVLEAGDLVMAITPSADPQTLHDLFV